MADIIVNHTDESLPTFRPIAGVRGALRNFTGKTDVVRVCWKLTFNSVKWREIYEAHIWSIRARAGLKGENYAFVQWLCSAQFLLHLISSDAA